jgi:putative sterol carrier protein
MPTPGDILSNMPEQFDADAARGLNVVVQFHLGGPDGGTHHVVIRDGTIEVARGAHQKPTMSLTLEGADFVALATGELRPQLAFMNRKVQITGDLGMASKLLAILGIGRR